MLEVLFNISMLSVFLLAGAVVYWAGSAPKIAQVINYTFTYASGATYTIQLGSAVLVINAITNSNATAAAAQAALAASTQPQFTEIIWTVSTNVLTATAATAGLPFPTNPWTVVGMGASISVSIITPTSSPNDLSVPDNYSTGTYPGSGDTFEFPVGSPAVYYNLDYLGDHSGIHIAEVNIPAAYTAAIGLPTWNSNGYLEYRATAMYLQPGPASASVALNLGYGPGRGSPMINIAMSGGAMINAVVTLTASNPTSPLGAFNLAGCTSGSTLELISGSCYLGSGVTLSSLYINSGVTLASDFGATVIDLFMYGGTASLPANTSMVIEQTGGTLTTFGTGTLDSITIIGASSPGPTLIFNNSGGYNGGNFVIGPFATVDFSQDPAPKNLNAKSIDITSGTNTGTKPAVASWLDPNGVTGTGYSLNPINCSISQCNIVLGQSVSIIVG